MSSQGQWFIVPPLTGPLQYLFLALLHERHDMIVILSQHTAILPRVGHSLRASALTNASFSIIVSLINSTGHDTPPPTNPSHLSVAWMSAF